MQGLVRLLLLLIALSTLTTAWALTDGANDDEEDLGVPKDAQIALLDNDAALAPTLGAPSSHAVALGKAKEERTPSFCLGKEGGGVGLEEENTCLWNENERLKREIEHLLGRGSLALARSVKTTRKASGAESWKAKRRALPQNEEGALFVLGGAPPPPPLHYHDHYSQDARRPPLIDGMASFVPMAEDHHRRLSDNEGTCTASASATHFSVSNETGLKNAVACANGNPNQGYVIGVTGDVQFSSAWSAQSGAALYIKLDAKLEIKSAKPGGELAAIRGTGTSGNFRIFMINSRSEVNLTKLLITDGYSNL